MNREELMRGTSDYELLKKFKRTSARVIDRSINRVGIDIKFDSHSWPDLADELEEVSGKLANAAVLTAAFAADARAIELAFTGASLIEKIEEDGTGWLEEILRIAKKSDDSETINSKDVTPKI
jgi:hypothetical protein